MLRKLGILLILISLMLVGCGKSYKVNCVVEKKMRQHCSSWETLLVRDKKGGTHMIEVCNQGDLYEIGKTYTFEINENPETKDFNPELIFGENKN